WRVPYLLVGRFVKHSLPVGRFVARGRRGVCYDRGMKNGRPAASSAPDTASRILDIAERLAQTRGFNGFSYADVSQELGITKASLHHHFESKAELGRALIARYSENFSTALAAIDRGAEDAIR